jgi:hypothetical protein
MKTESCAEEQGDASATASLDAAGKVPQPYLQMIRQHLSQLGRR